jgi:DNA-binding MarR family transcriptional regulator
MTRLVDDLQDRGLVAKRASTEDGRGSVAELTPAGLAKLRAAWPAHLASVRCRVVDHVDPSALKKGGASPLRGRPRARRESLAGLVLDAR